MDSMGDWCKENHGISGLTERVLASTTSFEEAEGLVLNFIKNNIPQKGVGILAGNSIHQDRLFLLKDMPRLLEHLHYRIIDVSTIKELCRSWNPKVLQQGPVKKMTHRALDDILESIQELDYYKSSFFKLD
jgi:oligoribonuclease